MTPSTFHPTRQKQPSLPSDHLRSHWNESCTIPLTDLPVLPLCFVELIKVKSLLSNPHGEDCDSWFFSDRKNNHESSSSGALFLMSKSHFPSEKLLFNWWNLDADEPPKLRPSASNNHLPFHFKVITTGRNAGRTWRSAAAALIHCQLQWAASLSTGPPSSLELILISHILFHA